MNIESYTLMTDLVLNCLWQAGCLTLVTLIVISLTRRTQLAMRKLALGFLLLGWLVLPIWNFIAVPTNLSFQQLSIRSTETPAIPDAAPTLARSEILALEPDVLDGMLPTTEPLEQPAAQTSFPVSALYAVGIVWLVGIVVGLVKLSIDQFALSRVLRRLKPVNDERVSALWDDATASDQVNRVPHLLTTNEIETPFSTGWFRPRIVLPGSSIESWTDKEIVAAMTHELAHWRQRDLISCQLQRLAQIVYWWNPVIPLLNRKLNHVQEVICDTIAVHSVSSQRDYARLLIKIAENLRGPAHVPSGAVGMARNISSLEQRIQTITSRKTNMKSIEMKRWSVILACSTACCLALPILGVQVTHADNVTAGIRETDVDHTEERDVTTTLKRKPGSKGVAEIKIQENGVTRTIRVPLSEDVRNASIQDLIRKMDAEEPAGELHFVPREDLDLHVDIDEHVEHLAPPEVPGPPPSPIGRFQSDDDVRVQFKRKSTGEHMDEDRVDIFRDGRQLNWTAKASSGTRLAFVPEEMEIEIRKDIEKARNDIDRARKGAEEVVREERVQRREMQQLLRSQQQEMQEMIREMARQVEELRRENAEIREDLTRSN